MAGPTLAEAQQMLDAYMAAERAVLLGQEYRLGGRLVRRTDLDMLRKGRQEWVDIVTSLSGGGIQLMYPDLAQ